MQQLELAIRGLNRMYDVYRDFMIKRSQDSRSIPHRASLVLDFVVDQRVLENDGLQLFLRALNAQTSDRQNCRGSSNFPLSLAPASSRDLQLGIEDRFFGHAKRAKKSYWLLRFYKPMIWLHSCRGNGSNA